MDIVFVLLGFLISLNVAGSVSFLEDTTLTKEQSITLDKFKRQVIPLLKDDWMKEEIFLIRFLRAKDFDASKAETMLLKHVQWRKDLDMDNIYNDDWSDLKIDYPYSVDARDKEGRVVIQFYFDEWDVRKAVQAGRVPRLSRYAYKMLEDATIRVRELADKGENVTRWSMVLNMDKINIGQHMCPRCIAFILEAAVVYDQQYPNLGNDIMMLKTPSIFETVIAIIRPLIREDTSRSLQAYGKARNVWLSAVQEKIELSELTSEFGGTKFRST